MTDTHPIARAREALRAWQAAMFPGADLATVMRLQAEAMDALLTAMLDQEKPET